MLTRRAAPVSGVLLALLAGAGGAVLGQSDDEVPARAIPVTGTDSCLPKSPGTQSIEPGGIDRVRGEVVSCELTSSDPLLSGDFTFTYNHDCRLTSTGSVECIYFGTAVQSTDERGWDCTWAGGEDPRGENWGLVLQVCTGTGAFEGLSWVGHLALGEGPTPGDLGDGNSFRGLVFEGAPPLLALPAE